MSQDKPTYVDFDKESYHWKPDINYRKHPEKYKIGRGEQGVLICEPYKSEICPHWKFKNEYEAGKSAHKIYEMFLNYMFKNDFVGADMARKYLQMGFTRARRYAKRGSGKKWEINEKNEYVLTELDHDPEKQKAAEIFKAFWKMARTHEKYRTMMDQFREKYYENY